MSIRTLSIVVPPQRGAELSRDFGRLTDDFSPQLALGARQPTALA
jgi:hypothetical protein